MINLPKFNIMNSNKLLVIFFVCILFYILIYLDVNKILVMIFLILFFVYHEKFTENANEFFFKKRSKDVNYNNKIEELLYKIEEIKHISPYKYHEGYNLWKMFIVTINKLESEKLYNYNHYFESAYIYLKGSCNTFMELIIGSKERKYIDGLEYGDFENTKDINRRSKIIKELYKEGYTLLYNISLRLNQKWEKEPNIHNKEIVFNVPEPRESMKENKYDYF